MLYYKCEVPNNKCTESGPIKDGVSALESIVIGLRYNSTQCESASTNQCESASTNQCESASTNQCESASTNQCESASTNQ